MTPREMQVSFTEKLESGGILDIVPSRVIFELLNGIQDTIVEELYLGLKDKEERVDDLKSLLVREYQIITTSTDEYKFNNFKYDIAKLPTNYRNIVTYRTRVKFNRKGIIYTLGEDDPVDDEIVEDTRIATGPYYSTLRMGRLAESDEVQRLLDDPFNRTTRESPLGDIGESGLFVYTDYTFIVDKVYLNYIRNPPKIDLTTGAASLLPAHLHERIVERAVALYISRNSSSPNSQPQ